MKYKIKVRSMITVVDIVTLPDVHSDEYEYNSGTYYSDVHSTGYGYSNRGVFSNDKLTITAEL